MDAQICVERGLGSIVVVTPIPVEVWMSWWWNDRGHVGSERGSRATVDYARSHLSHRRERVLRLGAPWLPVLPEGSTCPSGEVGKGVGHFDDVIGARERRRNVARGAYLAQDLSARLGWDEVFCLCRKRLTCC
jgi:hypothetical protein